MGIITIPGSQFVSRKATQYNGVDEYGYVDDPSFKSDTQGAFAFWYTPTTVLSAVDVRSMLSYGVKAAGNNAQLTLAQRYNTSTTINATYRSQPIPDVLCRTGNNTTIRRAYGNHIFTAGVKVLWVFESDGTTWKHWINGVDVGGTGWNSNTNTGDWLGDISGASHRLAFGAQFVSNAPAMYDPCKQDEGMYFNRPLTSGEHTWLYHGGEPRNPLRGGFGSDLTSLWRMGESRDNATTIFDEIGSNNITLVNMDTSNYGAS